MTTKKTDLADVLSQIDKSAQATEALSARILDAIREAKTENIEAFDTIVYAAYDKNGWSYRVGRPLPGDMAAPNAVKVYVSTVRAAFRAGVKVLEMQTMDALRKALRHAKDAARQERPAAKVPPEMKGVQVEKPHQLTGALFHDAAVLWDNLPDSQRTAFEQKLQKLVEQFVKRAPPALRLVA